MGFAHWAIFICFSLGRAATAFAADGRELPVCGPGDDLERVIQRLSAEEVNGALEPPKVACAEMNEVNGEKWKSQWIREGWKFPVRQTIGWKEIAGASFDCKRFTHEFRPTFVVSRQAGWTEAMIRDHLRLSASIYSRCGIRLGNTEVVWADATPSGVDLDAETATKLGFKTPVEARPLIYFVRVPGTAFNALLRKNEPLSAFAYARLSVKKLPESLQKFTRDTAFIGNEVRTPEYISARQRFGRYDPVAHELAHLFCNCDHVSGPKDNLLQEYQGLVSPRLEPKQCETFKKSPLMHPLSPENRCL